MPDDARQSLADQQMQLVRAMTGGISPPGFDESRVVLAAKMLLNKRSRTVARCWPRLAAVLGPQFAGLFSQYANEQKKPSTGGGISDGVQFLRFLKSKNNLPDEGRLEWLAYRVRRGNFGFTWLTQPRGFAIGLRSRVMSFPFSNSHERSSSPIHRQE